MDGREGTGGETADRVGGEVPEVDPHLDVGRAHGQRRRGGLGAAEHRQGAAVAAKLGCGHAPRKATAHPSGRGFHDREPVAHDRDESSIGADLDALVIVAEALHHQPGAEVRRGRTWRGRGEHQRHRLRRWGARRSRQDGGEGQPAETSAHGDHRGSWPAPKAWSACLASASSSQATVGPPTSPTGSAPASATPVSGAPRRRRRGRRSCAA